MRLMEFEPYGHASFHKYLEEHKFYVLEGDPAYVDANGNETRPQPGDTVYCGPASPDQEPWADPYEDDLYDANSYERRRKSPALRPDGSDYVTEEKPES